MCALLLVLDVRKYILKLKPGSYTQRNKEKTDSCQRGGGWMDEKGGGE